VGVVDPAGVQGKWLNLPWEVCDASRIETEGTVRFLTAKQKSAEGIVSVPSSKRRSMYAADADSRRPERRPKGLNGWEIGAFVR
jgi:hypothetical protein